MRQASAIFGGSFDPPHAGHAGMVRAALARPDIGRVRLVPALVHRRGKRLSDFGHRVAMCRLMAAEIGPGCEVGRDEEDADAGGLSADLVRHLAARFPSRPMRFLVGEDVFAHMHLWPDFQVIEALAPPLVLPRLTDAEGRDISSTRVRAMMRDNEDPRPLISGEIDAYRVHNRLYCGD